MTHRFFDRISELSEETSSLQNQLELLETACPLNQRLVEERTLQLVDSFCGLAAEVLVLVNAVVQDKEKRTNLSSRLSGSVSDTTCLIRAMKNRLAEVSGALQELQRARMPGPPPDYSAVCTN